MAELSIVQTDESWSVCPDEDRLTRIVKIIAEGEDREFASLSVVFADHPTVLELNREWLDHDWHTDVISFLLEDDPIEGEVYVDVETAMEQFEEFGSSLKTEIERYLIHGILHLCSHDDATDDQREAMRVLEDRYLAQLGA